MRERERETCKKALIYIYKESERKRERKKIAIPPWSVWQAGHSKWGLKQLFLSCPVR